MMKFIATVCTMLLHTIMVGQQLAVPENFAVVDSIQGDLDRDGQNELVVAFNTRPKQNEDTFESVPRELVIYKLTNGQWVVWKRSNQVLYGSHDGGMMGDPYGEMQIQDGILYIAQSGGSSWKWSHTDIYRYQAGDFLLIGYKSYYGKPCEYWTDVNFNLLSGELVVKKDYENCDNDDPIIYKQEHETIYRKGLRIALEERNAEEIIILTKKYGHQINVANAN